MASKDPQRKTRLSDSQAIFTGDNSASLASCITGSAFAAATAIAIAAADTTRTAAALPLAADHALTSLAAAVAAFTRAPTHWRPQDLVTLVRLLVSSSPCIITQQFFTLYTTTHDHATTAHTRDSTQNTKRHRSARDARGAAYAVQGTLHWVFTSSRVCLSENSLRTANSGCARRIRVHVRCVCALRPLESRHLRPILTMIGRHGSFRELVSRVTATS